MRRLWHGGPIRLTGGISMITSCLLILHALCAGLLAPVHPSPKDDETEVGVHI